MAVELSPDLKLSRNLNDLAGALDDRLVEIAGAPVAFLLMCLPFPSRDVQYIANVSHADGADMVKGLLKRWNDPAELPDLPLDQKEELLLRLLTACKAYHQALDMAFAQLIKITHKTAGMEPFLPSESPHWAAIVQGNAAIAETESALALARELAKSGAVVVPAAKDRH